MSETPEKKDNAVPVVAKATTADPINIQGLKAATPVNSEVNFLLPGDAAVDQGKQPPPHPSTLPVLDLTSMDSFMEKLNMPTEVEGRLHIIGPRKEYLSIGGPYIIWNGFKFQVTNASQTELFDNGDWEFVGKDALNNSFIFKYTGTGDRV